MKKTNGLLIILIFLSTCKTFENKKLQKAASQDLEFINQQIINNHPGIHNTEDPLFKDLVKAAYEEAKRNLSSISSKKSYYEWLKNYLAQFNDVHLGFYTMGLEERLEKMKEKKSPQAKDFFIKSIGKNSILIFIPTFSPTEKQKEQIQHIIKRLPQMRNKKFIIFDIRESCEGNSIWGTKLIEALFSHDYAQNKINEMKKNVFIDWRASKDNIKFLEKFLDKKSTWSSMIDESEETRIKNLITGMQEALKKGAPYYIIKNIKDHKYTNSINPVKAQIIILISPKNVSASLDFIDEIKSVDPSTQLVGTKTGADTMYMDLQEAALPSGLSYFFFPMKVYRGRPRKSHEPYIPDIIFEGKAQEFPFDL